VKIYLALKKKERQGETQKTIKTQKKSFVLYIREGSEYRAFWILCRSHPKADRPRG
jgi:hypothetical protein